MTWFNKNIKKDDLDKMDGEFTSKYGQVKIVKDEDIVVSVEELENVINEFDQVYDEETNDVVDYDETVEEI